MNFKATGVGGGLTVGGRPAATLGKWTVETHAAADGAGADAVPWTLRATLTERDDHWLEAASEFDLRLDLNTTRWRWRRLPAVQVVAAGDDLTVTGHGAPEDD